MIEPRGQLVEVGDVFTIGDEDEVWLFLPGSNVETMSALIFRGDHVSFSQHAHDVDYLLPSDMWTRVNR